MAIDLEFIIQHESAGRLMPSLLSTLLFQFVVILCLVVLLTVTSVTFFASIRQPLTDTESNKDTDDKTTKTPIPCANVPLYIPSQPPEPSITSTLSSVRFIS